MAAPITISKDIKITQVVAASRVPPVKVMPGMLENLDEIQGIQWTQKTTERRKEMLLRQLDLSGLERWSGANCMPACTMLIEYHYVFSLESEELGCTSFAKHEI